MNDGYTQEFIKMFLAMSLEYQIRWLMYSKATDLDLLYGDSAIDHYGDPHPTDRLIKLMVEDAIC